MTSEGAPLRVLVLGGNGQDGSYICEHAIARGHAVLSLGRDEGPRYAVSGPLFQYRRCDLRDAGALREALDAFQPDRIVHVAAVHGPADSSYEEKWRDALDVNVGAMHTCLEHARLQAPRCRAFYASSSKVFGDPLPSVVTLETPRTASCLYSITKIAAENLINFYRHKYGMPICIGFFFNHNSSRRLPGYFMPKIVRILDDALSGHRSAERLDSLNFHADWGDAEEYAGMVLDAMELAPDRDLIFATGRTWSGREFAEALFSRFGLNAADWLPDMAAAKPDRNGRYQVDVSETVRYLGRSPQRSALDVAEAILAHRRAVRASLPRRSVGSLEEP